jgi:hypothetical protein
MTNETKEQLEKQIERLLTKWSTTGLNKYEKIALKNLENKYKTLQK